MQGNIAWLFHSVYYWPPTSYCPLTSASLNISINILKYILPQVLSAFFEGGCRNILEFTKRKTNYRVFIGRQGLKKHVNSVHKMLKYDCDVKFSVYGLKTLSSSAKGNDSNSAPCPTSSSFAGDKIPAWWECYAVKPYWSSSWSSSSSRSLSASSTEAGSGEVPERAIALCLCNPSSLKRGMSTRGWSWTWCWNERPWWSWWGWGW